MSERNSKGGRSLYTLVISTVFVPLSAKEHLNKVIKDFPHTREAELAKEKLGKIGK